MDEEIWTGLEPPDLQPMTCGLLRQKLVELWATHGSPTFSLWTGIVEWLLIQVFGLWAYLNLS